MLFFFFFPSFSPGHMEIFQGGFYFFFSSKEVYILPPLLFQHLVIRTALSHVGDLVQVLTIAE